jgi:3-deoxy-manno-octulosonate cytidylyltransferase (CMP-KDO synthetase)
MSRVLGVIPARLSSTRLPNKPLYPIHGLPLIQWVWQRVEGMRVLDQVVVATDSEEVAAVCRSFGASVELTREDHPSGTDRVAEVAGMAPYEGFRTIVNIQGDEPLMEESHVAAAVAMVEDAGWDIGTCAAPITSVDDLADPSVVKVARASSGAALYFSRAAIPFMRDGQPSGAMLGSGLFLRHVGIYAFRREALSRWVALPPSPLETIERLEQLRPMEAGMKVGVAQVSGAEGGVDTPEDAQRISHRLAMLDPLARTRIGR